MATKKVTLDPGESQEVAFTFTPNVAKVYAVSINGLSGSFQALGRVELELSINLEPVTESPSPGVIYVGGMIELHGIVTNVGAVSGSYHIEWFINGVKVWEDDRSIAAGNTHDNSRRYTVPEVGHYNIVITVNELVASDSFDAIEAPPGLPDIRGHKPIVMSPISVGEHLYSDMWPSNEGDGTGSYSLEWHLIDPDGIDTLVKTQTGTLAPGAYDCLYCTEPILTKIGIYTVKCILSWDGHVDEYSANVEVYG